MITLETACASEVLPPGVSPHGSTGVSQHLDSIVARSPFAAEERPDDGSSPTAANGGADPTCVSYQPSAGWARVSQDGRELPFAVGAAFVRWDVADCTDARLLVGLTDGECSTGVGRQLLFVFDRDLGEPGLHGPVLIQPTPNDDMVHVEFRIPRGSEPPDIWGSCFGAEGVLTVAQVGFNEGDPLAASFDLRLTDCTAPTTAHDIRVDGAMNLSVPMAFAEACR